MTNSLFFYDLETTGLNPRESRIIQFAGQRTDLNLEPIGEPYNILIKLSNDVLPDPNAILVTGITPQKTIDEGITEAEFLRIFHEEIAVPGTIFTGFNTIRFDDEFMRYLMYRNFYDAYEWQWQDSRSRWDILDLVRMTRALRPEGINWPVDSQGQPTNRLEQLTALNGLDHQAAHDALSDVEATIGVARLIRKLQPKLFDYLLSMRHKKAVNELVDSNQPFVYTSGRYENEFEKTTVAVKLCDHPRFGALVYDLRYDPEIFHQMDNVSLLESLKSRPKTDNQKLPVKILRANRCPAVAPVSVMDQKSFSRIKLKPSTYESNFKKLSAVKESFCSKVLEVFTKLQKERDHQAPAREDTDVDARLYEAFIETDDKNSMSVVRAAEPSELGSLNVDFKDDRLNELLPIYKARNYPKSLTSEELKAWDEHRKNKLLSDGQESRAAKYFAQLTEIAQRPDLTTNDQYLLEELKLYGESIMPVFD